MPEPIRDIAEDLIELLLKNGKDVITIPWPEMYDFCGRDRIKRAFKEQLKKELNLRTYQIDYEGQAVTVFRQTNFAPVKMD